MMKFEFYKDTLREVLETLITWDGIESLKIEKYASGWKVVGNDYDNDVEYSGNDLDKIARKVQADVVKRNKQVDVPTEAWQKNVERRLDKITDILLGFIINEQIGEIDGESLYRLSSTKYHKDLSKR